jgi:hypothetical protein
MAQKHFLQCQHCLAHTDRPAGWHLATSTCPACLLSENDKQAAPAWTVGAVELVEPARRSSSRAARLGPVKPSK